MFITYLSWVFLSVNESWYHFKIFYRELYAVALENDASCVEALYNLGLCNKKLGMYDDALEVFFKLHNILRNHSQVRYNNLIKLKMNHVTQYILFYVFPIIFFLGSLPNCQYSWAPGWHWSSNRMVFTAIGVDPLGSRNPAEDGRVVW